MAEVVALAFGPFDASAGSQALHRRDHGVCRFPGCSTTTWLHAHHIVHWADGGPTDLDNLISLCGYHHRLVHEAGWTVEILDHTDITWIDPDGRPVGMEPLAGTARPIATGDCVPRRHDTHIDYPYVISVVTDAVRHRRTADDENVPAETPDAEAAGRGERLFRGRSGG